jgi:hypothetical protein
MAMSQQMSLRVPEEVRGLIRERLAELRRGSDRPERLTEADAARSLILEGLTNWKKRNDEQQ